MDPRVELLPKFFERGMPNSHIARELHMDHNRVARYRRDMGYPTWGRSGVNPRRKFTDEQFLAEYHQGKTNREIAEALNASERTVNEHRRRLGLTSHPKAIHGQVKFDHEFILELVRSGLSEKSIAKRVGCNVMTVHRVKKKAGLVEPHPSKALPPLKERLESARADLEDGYPYTFVQARYHIGNDTIRRHLPGYGWSRQQSGEAAGLAKEANRVYRRLGV